jgi:hypothetical protein
VAAVLLAAAAAAAGGFLQLQAIACSRSLLIAAAGCMRLQCVQLLAAGVCCLQQQVIACSSRSLLAAAGHCLQQQVVYSAVALVAATQWPALHTKSFRAAVARRLFSGVAAGVLSVQYHVALQTLVST